MGTTGTRITTLALFLLAAVGSADTLYIDDGRTLKGELFSISRGVVLFDEERPGTARPRRVRMRLERVEKIDFIGTEEEVVEDLDYTGNRRDRFDRNREIVVTVPADQAWTDTGIDVRAGDTLTFLAEGTIAWGPGRQDGPEGEAQSPSNAGRPMPDRPGAALIGKIGSSSRDYFLIGNDRGTFRVRTAGRLYLGINDDHLLDNSGRFHVTVTR